VRYTRIGMASYAIASVLVVVVVGVAWARSRVPASPAGSPAEAAQPAGRATAPAAGTQAAQAAPSTTAVQESGAAAYRSECGACHGEGEARGRSIPALRGFAVELFTSEGGREYLIDFMLDGRVRSVEGGRTVYVDGHPSYDALSDEAIAAVLEHMLVSWGNDELLPADRRPYAASEVAARR
jgi:mono/diheme cytochrome c family protein